MHVEVSEISYRIGSTKGYSSSLTKKRLWQSVRIFPFSPVALINIASFNLRALMGSKKAGKISPRKVWIPKYCQECVDMLNKEWSTVCTDPTSRSNSVKGIQQGAEQHNQFSREMRLSLKGKMNSLGDGFVPLREKAVERPAPPWGRFIASRKNDVGRFRECSSRRKAFSPRGKFTPPNDKVVGKVIVSRKKVNNLFFQGRGLHIWKCL